MFYVLNIKITINFACFFILSYFVRFFQRVQDVGCITSFVKLLKCFFIFQISEYQLEATTMDDEYDPFDEREDLPDNPIEDQPKSKEEPVNIFR